MTGKALFAAGGTGGHMFPARAAADALIARGWEVRLVTDARGAKHARDFPGGDPVVIEAQSPFQKNPVRLVGALASLAKGYRQTSRLMADFQPDVVAGFGGYPAFPVLAAARSRKVPFVIHEQNAVLGRVNRLFSGSAVCVASGFERLDRASVKVDHKVVGNPVRAAVLKAAETPYAAPPPEGEFRLLVIGGSLGARLLSVTVPRAVAVLPEALRQRLKVVQQTREETLDEARQLYSEAGVEAELAPFFQDMGKLYADAHLVISRAGASSVSEIAAIGRPAIFVPLAVAMDDHQTANAESLVEAGAAEAISEAELTVQRLRESLETAMTGGEALSKQAEAARALGKPSAHEHLADLIEAAAEAS
ncbi:MAG: undecaprenyldiphospho-muramoylpentapeptide beta-N-acetylglucosaminyltransferase [Alphaproteobacteria bacterium]|nr:undecaprenyldiphospho-muramoylpentapeptide beta-N-acetylglucosaminyltransferase [Alphaproteobacteria bacterium]